MSASGRSVGGGALGTPAAAAAAAAAAVPAGGACNHASSPAVAAAPLTPAKATANSQAQAAQPYGTRLDLPRLHVLMKQQAAEAGLPLHQAWHQAQAAVVQHALQLLVCQLESMPSPPIAQAKPTAGVSYVVHTESQQHGAHGLPCLPHLVYQPPGLREVAGPGVDALVATLSNAVGRVRMLRVMSLLHATRSLPKILLMHASWLYCKCSLPGTMQSTAAAVLPLREENHMKSYLLLPAQRHALLQQLCGRLVEAPQGALGLEPLLQDRALVCLHYHLDAHGRLHPCSTGGTGTADGGSSTLGAAPDQQQQQQQQWHGIEQSNVQLGVMVRKGVGGTCPLRAAARRLAAGGIIAALLDGPPPRDTPSTAAAEPCGATTASEPGLPSPAAGGQHPQQLCGGDAPCTPAPAARAAAAASSGPGSAAASLAAAPPAHLDVPARTAAVAPATAESAAKIQLSSHASKTCVTPPAGQAVTRNLAAALMDALVEAAEADDSAAAADGAAVAAAGQSAGAAPAKHPTATTTCAVPQAAQAAASAPMQISTTELEAALLKAAAELRAAEAAAAATADPADEQLPDFEAEDGLGEEAAAAAAAAAGSAAESASQGADDASSANKAAADAGVAGEEGAEELLRELQEQQLLPELVPDCDASAAAVASQAPAPLPPVHPRLTFYTLSSRLELYVQQDTWEQLDRPSRDALFSAARALELLLLQELAAANRRRLLDFCRRLQAAVGREALPSSLGCTLLGSAGQQQAAVEAAAPLDYYEALALASACWLAGDGSRSAALQVPHPYYLIGTRDSFTHHLVPLSHTVEVSGRRYTRTRYFLRVEECPDNYHQVLAACAMQPTGGRGSLAAQQAENASCCGTAAGDDAPTGLLPIGVTTYTQLFTDAELAAIEEAADELDGQLHEGRLPEACFHRTVARGGGVKRTKFFFGARYTWTRDQLAEPDAKVAGGVRVDVPQPPAWMRQRVEAPLVQAQVLAPGFVDSIALNIYHDGSEGIQSHYDDADRFQQPIISLRLWSDSRLSFGTQLYGYTNGTFCVPLPRGCITVMEEGGYAANGIKHCVRPMDMSGKSAGMILRRINSNAREEAEQHHLEETCAWLRCLSLDASTRAATLLAQRQAAAGRAGRAGAPRQARTPAAERREIWRVLQELIRRVEQRQRQDQLEDVTAQLMLLSAVRKVEAAERLGLDLCQDGDEAAAVLSVLDDMVSYVERPAAASMAPRQARMGARGQLRGSSAAAQEVGRCLHRMVVAVEQEEQAEQREVVQVAYSLACCAAAAAEWEDSGQAGPQPAYALLPLPLSAASVVEAPVRQQGAVAALLGGSSSASAGSGEAAASGPALLQQQRQPNAATGLQACLGTPEPAARAAAAAPSADAVMSGADGKPPAVVLQCDQVPQPQAAAGCLAIAQRQAQAAQQQPVGPPAGYQQLLGPAQQAASLPGVYAAALAAAVQTEDSRSRPSPLVDSSNSSSGGSQAAQRPPLRRSGAAGKAHAAVCFACCTGVAQEVAAAQLWACTGPCRRTFHHSCKQPANGSGSFARRCQECLESSHPCFACGKPAGPAGTVSCSMSRCCRQYHWDCLVANPLSKVSATGRSAKCPLHYCAQCGTSGDGVAMVQCLLCDRAWHARCRPHDVRLVSKRFVVCPRHGSALLDSPGTATRAEQLVAQQHGSRQQQQEQQRQQVQALQLPSRKRLHANASTAAAGKPANEQHNAGICTAQQVQQQQPGEDAEDGQLAPEPTEQLAACEQQERRQAPGGKRPRLAADSSTATAVVSTSQLLHSPSNRSSSLGAPTPLSPRLQPSWQASLAARASLDYGDL